MKASYQLSALCLMLMSAAGAYAQAAAAASPITIYGRLDLSYGRETKTDKVDLMSGYNTPSVFGVKGQKDFDDGISGFFRLETSNLGADGSIGDASLFGRAAYAGLKGGFGAVLAGRIASVAFQNMLAYDLNGFADSSAYLRAGIQPTMANNLGTRRSRQIQYATPKLEGFQALAGYTPRDTAATSNQVGSIAATYAIESFSMGAVYESPSYVANGFGTDLGDKAAVSLGASYDFGVAKIAFSMTTAGTDPYMGANGEVNRGAGFGVQVPIAGFNIGFQYAKNTANGIGAGELYLNREIFKDTTFHIDIGSASKSKLANYGDYYPSDNTFSVGVIYTFN